MFNLIKKWLSGEKKANMAFIDQLMLPILRELELVLWLKWYNNLSPSILPYGHKNFIFSKYKLIFEIFKKRQLWNMNKLMEIFIIYQIRGKLFLFSEAEINRATFVNLIGKCLLLLCDIYISVFYIISWSYNISSFHQSTNQDHS